ncbi:MAG: hypothetical protein GTO41_13655, partial [Burkholderiales bacterium]|nr:hypothetical protein [Burkholderiales bacterium]
MNIEQLISSNTGGVYQFATASAAAHPPRFPEATNYLTVDTVIVSDKASFLDATSTALGF